MSNNHNAAVGMVAVVGAATGITALVLAGVNTTSINNLNSDMAATQARVTTLETDTLALPSGQILVGDVNGRASKVTMSGDATIDNQGAVTIGSLDQVVLKNALGDEIKLTAPVATFTDYALTFPANDGTASQFLSTDGAGVMSWATPTGTSLGESRFYGMVSGTGNSGANDYSSTVAVGAPVPFPRDGFLSGSIVRASTTAFTLPFIGTYEISWQVHTTELGQLQLEVAGAVVATSTAANFNPTSGGHPIAGTDIVTTVTDGVAVRVLNPAGNSTALTVTVANGSQTHATAQWLKIRRIV